MTSFQATKEVTSEKVTNEVRRMYEQTNRKRKGKEAEEQEALTGFLEDAEEGIDWLGGEYIGKKQRLQKELVRLGGGSEW